MDWTDLTQGRNQWTALVTTVMNHRVPYNVGKFLSGLAASQQGLSSMKSVDGTVSTADFIGSNERFRE